MPENEKPYPPYVAYETFMRFVDHLREIGLPQRIDRSIWESKFSGSSGGESILALKFFGLLDENDQPQPTLREIVQAEGGERKQVLRRVLEEGYKAIFSRLDPSSATPQMLTEAFRESFARMGATPQRKAETFFRKATADVGLLTSPHILQKPRRAPRRTNGPKKQSRANDKAAVNPPPPPPANAPAPLSNEQHAPPEVAQMVFEKMPDFDPEWEPEVQQKWFEAMERVTRMLTGQQ